MRKVLDILYSGGLYLAAVCLVTAAALVIVQIVGRLAGLLVPSVPELAGFLLGATIFLALAGTERADEHIRVTLLLEKAGPRLRRTLEILYRLVGIVLTAILTWYMAWLAYDSWDFGDKSAGMIGIPYWIPQSAMTIGAMLLLIRFVDELVLELTVGKIGDGPKDPLSDLGAS
jgi:TRAP-type C4-dicarboxylate transport system permease small subunit